MRAVTAVMRQAGGFHSVSEAVTEETTFARERIHRFSVLEDGTAVVLCRVRGDLDRARELIDGHPDVLSSTITGGEAGEGLSYMHVRPPASIADLVELPRTHEIVFDFPLEGIDPTSIRVTMIAETNGTLRDALADVPAAVDVTVERIGAYSPEQGAVSTLLTDRQREILDVALESGYYEVPRQATHADIAARVDLDPGTVSEHMQKIEARVFGALVG